MNKTGLFLCLILCSSLNLMAQKGAKKQKYEELIKASSKKLETFYKKAMVDSIADMYSTNCFYVREFSPRLDSREDVKNKIASDYKAGYKVLDLIFTADDYKTYNDIVWEIGTLSVKFISPTTKTTLIKKYNYNIVWKESSDKKYRIRSEIWSPIENPCK